MSQQLIAICNNCESEAEEYHILDNKMLCCNCYHRTYIECDNCDKCFEMSKYVDRSVFWYCDQCLSNNEGLF